MGFKPDLLPNDITGVSIFNQKNAEFEFRTGPIFVNILLADEINRATPRTQSALLDAMQGQQVTVDGVTHERARNVDFAESQRGRLPLPGAARFGGTGDCVAASVAGGLSAGMNRLLPRHRAFFFSQAFLRHSSESGLPRSPAQTPQKFAASLDPALPQAEPDIHVLTAAFMETRYAPRLVLPERATLVQKTWNRLRKARRKPGF